MSLSQKTHIGLALAVILAVMAGRLEANSAPIPGQVAESESSDAYSQPPSPAMVATAPAEFTNWSFLDSDEETTSSELALVIPDKEMDLATTNQILEDLGIMSRIIEKNVLTPYGVRQAGWREVVIGRYGSPDVVGPRTLFPSGARIKPLYIAGYGATFFIQVDFPLAAPPQKTQEQAAPSQEDPVWAQTKQSVLESRSTGVASRGRGARATVGQPYNQGKVDGFRKSLIATMKHAANIQALDTKEWLTFVIQGSGPLTAGPEQGLSRGAVLPAVAASSGRSVMTLRATKADVDAYGKGQLSPEQFEQRVQTITY